MSYTSMLEGQNRISLHPPRMLTGRLIQLYAKVIDDVVDSRQLRGESGIQGVESQQTSHGFLRYTTHR